MGEIKQNLENDKAEDTENKLTEIIIDLRPSREFKRNWQTKYIDRKKIDH